MFEVLCYVQFALVTIVFESGGCPGMLDVVLAGANQSLVEDAMGFFFIVHGEKVSVNGRVTSLTTMTMIRFNIQCNNKDP